MPPGIIGLGRLGGALAGGLKRGDAGEGIGFGRVAARPRGGAACAGAPARRLGPGAAGALRPDLPLDGPGDLAEVQAMRKG